MKHYGIVKPIANGEIRYWRHHKHDCWTIQSDDAFSTTDLNAAIIICEFIAQTWRLATVTELPPLSTVDTERR